jgi:hypothetical protein
MAWYFAADSFYESHAIASEVKTETLLVFTVSSSVVNTRVLRGDDGETTGRQIDEDSLQ